MISKSSFALAFKLAEASFLRLFEHVWYSATPTLPIQLFVTFTYIRFHALND